MSNISTWSTAAASNNASSPDGFPEGMAPSGLNDSSRETMGAVRRWYDDAEWVNPGWTPTYVSAATFTLAGDRSAKFHTGRRIKAMDSGNTLYGTIHSSTYTGAASTGVYVTLDSGNFTASLSAISVGILSITNDSFPNAIKTDVISERTSASGVTIDSLLIKDGGISDGTNIIKTKIINIGDWNMDSTASVTIAHGLTLAKIRSATAVIRNDADDTHYPLTPGGGADLLAVVSGSLETVDAVNITLSRRTGGAYDAATFDATSFNRGWITIDYVV